MVGLPGNCKVEVDVFWTVLKALKIVGSFVGNRTDAIEALSFVEQGKPRATPPPPPLPVTDLLHSRRQGQAQHFD